MRMNVSASTFAFAQRAAAQPGAGVRIVNPHRLCSSSGAIGFVESLGVGLVRLALSLCPAMRRSINFRDFVCGHVQSQSFDRGSLPRRQTQDQRRS
jgi:hypothetical protein